MVGSTILRPSQVAGILEGDGGFTLLRRRAGGGGVRVRPQIALLMRDDDPTPLAVWTSIGSWAGHPVGLCFRSPHLRRHEWRVDRLADVVFVTEVLVRHPFLSPRGYRNLATLREIALILAAARAPGGGAKRMPLADQARLLELRELTPVRGASVERLPTAPTAELASDTHWGWHLSGFVAAEGHVSLRDAASKFAPQFTVVQRVDNIPLLEAYRDRLAIGTIRVRPAGRASIRWPSGR